MSGSNGYITKNNTIHIGNLTYAAIKRRITEGGTVPSLPDEYCAGHNLIVESYGVDESGCSYCDQTLIPGSYGHSSETSAYLVVPSSLPGDILLHSQDAGVMLKYSATYDSCNCTYCTYCCVYYTDMCLTTEAVNWGCYKKFTLSRAPYTVYFCNTCTGKTCLGTMSGNTCGGTVVTTVNALTLARTDVCALGDNYIIVCCGGNIGSSTTGPGTSTDGGVANLYCADCQIARFSLSKSNTSNACCCCCFGTNYII